MPTLELGYSKPVEKLIYGIGKSAYSSELGEQVLNTGGNMYGLLLGINERVGLNYAASRVNLGVKKGRLLSVSPGRYKVSIDSNDVLKPNEEKVFYKGESGSDVTGGLKYISSYGSMIYPLSLIPSTYRKENADRNTLHRISVKLGMGSVNPPTPVINIP